MKPKHFVVITLAGLLVIFDEMLKKIALSGFPKETEINGKKIIEFAVHQNTGIAFDLPFWPPLIFFLTALIVVGLIGLVYKTRLNKPWLSTAAVIIILGALGNLIDRISYGFIIDYIIFPFSGSAFNLSDVTIIIGILIVLFSTRKK